MCRQLHGKYGEAGIRRILGVQSLAKKYGITTPYTSYLIVPDGVMPVAKGPGRGLGAGGPMPAAEAPAALAPTSGATTARPVLDFVKEGEKGDKFFERREGLAEKELKQAAIDGLRAKMEAGKPFALAIAVAQEAGTRDLIEVTGDHMPKMLSPNLVKAIAENAEFVLTFLRGFEERAA